MKHFFPQKNPVDTWNAVFKTMQKILPKVRKSLDQTEKPKITILLKNLSSLQKTFGGMNYVFDSRLLKLFAKVQKTLHSKSENIRKKNCWSNYHLVKTKAILKMLSKNTTNSILFFRPRPEITKKLVPLGENRTLLQRLSGHLECHIQNHAKVFKLEAEKCWLKF